MDRGDPQLVAAPVFTIGSIALAFYLVEYVSRAALGTPLAIKVAMVRVNRATAIFRISGPKIGSFKTTASTLCLPLGVR